MEGQEKSTAAELELTEDVTAEEITPERVKRITVRIGGREIPLRYNVRTQIVLDDELDIGFGDLLVELNDNKKRNTKTVITILRVLGNEGLREAGQEADLTDDWIIDNMVPKDIISYRIAELMAVTKGWYMETDNSDEQEQDVTLIEIRKKNGNTD